MKKTAFLVWIVSLFLISTGIRANKSCFVLYETDTTIGLRFQLDAWEIRTVEIEGELYHYVVSGEMKYPVEPGIPLLPFLARSIIIPGNAGIKTEVVDIAFTEISTGPILPRSSDLSQIIPVGKENLIYGKNYEENTWFPNSVIKTGTPYIFRDYRGIVIYFQPFLYNPVSQKLKIIKRIDVRIDFYDSTNYSFERKTRRTPPAFENLYRHHFINYSTVSSKYPVLNDEGDMIIITIDEFVPQVQLFSNWKNRKGIKTSIVTYPLQTGPTPDAIKNYIQNVYDSTGSLAYILIIGDAEQVPPHPGYAGNPGFDADPVYTLLAGDDEYPDAFIGRFSVENNQQLATVIQKNLNYEMNPDPMGDWYHKATGIASDCNFPPIGYDTSVMNGICDSMLSYHYTHFDKIYDPGASVGELIAALNDGRSWLNYLGHGSPTGWSTTGCTVNHIPLLQNINMNPVVISVACNTGGFSGITCLAEAWQRAGSPEEPKGSIAFMGSTITQYNSATIGKLEMINLLVNDNFFTLGGIMFNGEMKSIDYYPGTGVCSGAECFQGWHLFGDPSLFVYSNTPGNLTIGYSSTVEPGDSLLNVEINDDFGPVQKALVAVSVESQLLGSAYTDESGLAAVIFSEAIGEISQLEVTVTAYNKLPLFDTIPVNLISTANNADKTAGLQIFPNPFRDFTTIEYFPADGRCSSIKLSCYSSDGKLIRNISEKRDEAYPYRFILSGENLTPGIYYLLFQSGRFQGTKKLFVLP